MSRDNYWLAYSTDSFGIFNEYPKKHIELQYKSKDFSYKNGTYDELIETILENFSYTDLFALCIDDLHELTFDLCYTIGLSLH